MYGETIHHTRLLDGPAYTVAILHRDTVSSVGYFRVHRLPGTYANENVDNLYHAVSLDERRVKFGKNLVSQEKSNNPKSPSKNFNEVWFAGCHTGEQNPPSQTL